MNSPTAAAPSPSPAAAPGTAATSSSSPAALPKGRIHIVLVGFMGSGKTSVGQMLAKTLGTPFIDLDDVVIRAAGKSIADIFRDHGEVAFRARERAALREVLSSETPQVIATGGGTFVDASARKWIKDAARTVYLKTSPEALSARIATGSARAQRPLLAGPDPVATIYRLLGERTPAYEEADLTVNTDGRSLQDVVGDVLRMLREPPSAPLRTSSPVAAGTPLSGHALTRTASAGEPLLMVNASAGSYPIELREAAGPWLAQTIARLCGGARIAVLSDTTVAPLHAQPLVNHLRDAGKLVTLHTVEAGEGSKSLGTAAELYDQLLEAGLTRADAVVAVGGGVVGDLAGFVASTFLRGVPFVQVPTTTLAAVDSSVGGKTAVNTPRGKNLVGTFYPPLAVLIAGQHLATQSRRAHSAGLVEALKMAATMDAQLFDDIVDHAQSLLSFDAAVLLPIIGRAVSLKADIVARDERESGDRAVLNYGHTIGHAIESGESYRLLHGEAVALGMVAEAEWAEQEGWSNSEVRVQIEQALLALEAPVDWQSFHTDVDALGLDKKRHGGGVRMPVVPALGTFELRTVALSALTAFLDRSEASP